MTQEEIKVVLEKHRHWLKQDCEGWEDMRANLHNANLSGANVYNADLSGADLHNANLSGANVYNADLHGANLHNANLSDANLHGANLSGANLSDANLHGANLYNANLVDANLVDANLNYANLVDANLVDANLNYANLVDANLSGADLHGAKNVPCIPMACPDTGAFIAYKKAQSGVYTYIVKLEIPEDAKRLSSTGRKCRCDKAKVLEIQFSNGFIADARSVMSMYDNSFIYTVGETVSVDNFDENRWNECSTGIHFFINRQEAVNY